MARPLIMVGPKRYRHDSDGRQRQRRPWTGDKPVGAQDRKTERKQSLRALWSALVVAILPGVAGAQTPPANSTTPAVPSWAQPGSANYTQVAPPADFHRATTSFAVPIGIFEAQSDVGSAVVPGKASFDAAKGQYTVTSAGYNVWYTRDEFRYLWKTASGDISMAADITFPNPNGYDDRKAVLIIRQTLDDDSKEVLVALHGGGMIQLAQRPQKNVRVTDMEYRIGSRGGLPGGKSPDSLVTAHAQRIGIEKHGDLFTLYVSLAGEPMHPFGSPVNLHMDGPFYVGIGFCSHLPDTADTAVFSNLVLDTRAGQVR